jgi:hypothetical protein
MAAGLALGVDESPQTVLKVRHDRRPGRLAQFIGV